MTVITQIQSPRGIRFGCSGCGNCCLAWPVPLTQEDYERISKTTMSSSVAAITRPLRSSRESLLSFTHTLEKRDDGKCAYLTDDNRCKLHAEYGLNSKPSMCQLFPYSFTVTPDAVLATLSFASSAVLYNTGALLSEQPETLENQYHLFRQLFNPKPEIWLEGLQVVDGKPLSWEQFKKTDAHLSNIVEGESKNDQSAPPQGMAKRLAKASAHILDELPDPSLAEREPKLESRPKIVDQILLKHLEKLYFPDDLFANQNYDLNAKAMLTEMISAPQVVTIGQAGREQRFSELIKIRLGSLPDQIENLFDRFLYVRFFSKQFFGPGFHHLSLLAGLNHLRLLHVLLRLKIKQHICQRSTSGSVFEEGKMIADTAGVPGSEKSTLGCRQSAPPGEFELAVELVRTLERRLTQLDFSPQSLAMLEVLLASPQRQERITFLAE